MYQLTKNTCAPEDLAELERGILDSEYMGPSPLGLEFVRTMGFSVVFHRDALSNALRRFPWLETFLVRAMFKATNAVYVNPLVLNVGSRVDPHADCRLLVRENVRIVPTLVSVLYVRSESDTVGGTLHLGIGTEQAVRIQPQTGDLLHFKGSVVHSVSEVRHGGPRVSVVCEQYNLPDELLPHFPKFLVIS